MPSKSSVIQFVRFETPLPKLMFLPLWTPIANNYLASGLAQIVLRQRSGASVLGDAPDYISRNQWPQAAFQNVLDRGEIGEGGGWPVKATQAGSYVQTEPVRSITNEETVIALLKTTEDAAFLSIIASFADAILHAHPVAEALTRYSFVVEISAKAGEGTLTAERLVYALAQHTKIEGSQIAVYNDALTLPQT